MAAALIALIDGDILAYEKAATAETRYDWNGDGQPAQTLRKEPEEVFEEVDREIATLRRKLGATRSVVCLSDPDANWRKGIYPLYKSNRVNVVKPLLLKAVKQHLIAGGAYVRPTLEADDVMGILATHPDIMPGEKVIVSIDKDMKTIPGLLFVPGWSEPRRITEEEADYNHLFQTLTGDPTDGYPGCPGIGPQRAAMRLDYALNGTPPEKRLWTMWATVLRTFEQKGLNEQYALSQARVSRICRHTDYDFNTKEVKLWQPPSAAS
jgi:DNA polymerase-1